MNIMQEVRTRYYQHSLKKKATINRLIPHVDAFIADFKMTYDVKGKLEYVYEKDSLTLYTDYCAVMTLNRLNYVLKISHHADMSNSAYVMDVINENPLLIFPYAVHFDSVADFIRILDDSRSKIIKYMDTTQRHLAYLKA